MLGEDLKWLQKILNRKPELTGVPSVRRQKTYSSDSGYVYQYSFSGFRQYPEAGDFLNEYVFDVSPRSIHGPSVSVFLRQSVLDSWVTANKRELNASERFGLAKMALKAQFDAWPTPADFPNELRPDASDIDAIAAVLDL
jgi:hypothetical protein